MIRITLKVDQVTYVLIQEMAKQVGVSDEEMVKAALYSVLGGYLQSKKKPGASGDVPVSGG